MISVQYNATPEVGSDTTHLSDLAFYEGAPMLPKSVPSKVSRLVTDADQLRKESMIIPVSPGTYRFVSESVGSYERFDLRKVTP